MWTEEKLVEDFNQLRILPGDSVIVHASMRAIGPVEGGADSVISALLETVGPEGSVMAPAFSFARKSEESPDVPAPDIIDRDRVGILPQRLALLPDARRSRHQALSFVAVGKNAEFLSADAPFHFPLGSESPLAKLYQLNGGILMIGVGFESNAALHLAEIWADVPYGRRQAVVPNESGEWQEMLGSPECGRGFNKIEPVLRQARIPRYGKVGDAPSQYMRIQYVVSMAVEMLKGNPESLLCDEPACAHCTLARRFTTSQTPLDRKKI